MSRQLRASADSKSGLSHLRCSVYRITFARVIGIHSSIRGGVEGKADTSQSEQENVNKPHPLVNVGFMNAETMAIKPAVNSPGFSQRLYCTMYHVVVS